MCVGGAAVARRRCGGRADLQRAVALRERREAEEVARDGGGRRVVRTVVEGRHLPTLVLPLLVPLPELLGARGRLRAHRRAEVAVGARVLWGER